MKTLQREVQVLYRFRCERCRSQFEMTAEEKRENDIRFTDNWAKQLDQEERYGWVPRPHNPSDKFDCPVCNCTRYVRRGDMHRYHVMDNGAEIQDY